jgi:hypothetical protein
MLNPWSELFGSEKLTKQSRKDLATNQAKTTNTKRPDL